MASSSKMQSHVRLRPSIVTACAYLTLLAIPYHNLRDTVGSGPSVFGAPTGEGEHEAEFGDPDQFAAYHAGIRSEEGQFSYPLGYRIEESKRALAARKKPGQKLNWVERGPSNVPGRTRAVVVDPSDPTNRTWFAGSVGGGLWKTENGGASWTPLTEHLPNLAVSALAIGTSDPKIIYMGTGEGFRNIDAVEGSGIFKSTDGGRTWTQLASTLAGSDFRYVNRLAIDPQDAQVVLAATNTGILRTEDGGSYWQRVFEGQKGTRVFDLKVRPDSFEIQFATPIHYGWFTGTPPEGVAKSIDGGRSWRMVLEEKDVGTFGRMELAIAHSNPDIVYASAEGGRNSLLFRSKDGGDTWIPVIDPSGSEGVNWCSSLGWFAQSIAVNPYDENHLFLGSVQLWQTIVDPDPVPHRYISEANENELPGLSLSSVGWQTPQGSRFVWTGRDHPEVVGITQDDFVRVEIRFGPGRSQKAHRYTVDEGLASLGSNAPLAEYRFKDYVAVPFEVWDVENDQQLTASFRDTADDGEYNLLRPVDPGWPDLELIFVHMYPYDAEVRSSDLDFDGGVANKMLYMIMLYQSQGDSTFVLDNLPASAVHIIPSPEVLRLKHKVTLLPASRTVHVDHHNITVLPLPGAPNRFEIVNANDGGVYFSGDGGSTFSSVSKGYNTTQFYGVDKKPGEDVYIAGAQDNGTWRSFPNPAAQQEWAPGPPGDGFETVWHSQDPNLVLASSQFNGLSRSTTAGAHFSNANKGLADFGFWRAPFITTIGNSKDAPDRVFVVGRQGVWRSEDFALSWHLVPIAEDYWRGNYAPQSGKVRVSLANPDVVWAGYRLDPRRPDWGTVHVSRDGGLTFSPTVGPAYAPKAGISGMATHPHQDSTAYVLFSISGKPKILWTTNWGQTWTDLSGYAESSVSTNGFPNAAVYDLLVFPNDSDVMWAGTEIGLFESTDAGATWQYSDNGLPAVAIWQMRVVDNQVVVATHGRGIWTIDLPSAGCQHGFWIHAWQ